MLRIGDSMKTYVTLHVEKEIGEKIIEDYAPYATEAKGEYMVFRAQKENLILTMYQKKDRYSATFEGENALEEAQKYDPTAIVHTPKKRIETSFLDFQAQIGSDEVGVGDFFGPIVVCAAYIDESKMSRLRELGIDDSKKMKDDKILEIGPSLLKEFTYSLLICDNDKYQELVQKGFNMNRIKAWLHNHAIGKVKKKIQKSCTIYLDAFCEEKTYYRYLVDAPYIVHDITFQTKAESYYPSVALASCIARYAFLKKMEEMENTLHHSIPLGASSKVTEVAKIIVEEHSLSYLDHFVKTNFKNYQLLLDGPALFDLEKEKKEEQ